MDVFLKYNSKVKIESQFKNPGSPLSLWLRMYKLQDYSESDWTGLEIFSLCSRMASMREVIKTINKRMLEQDLEIKGLKDELKTLAEVEIWGKK